MDKIKIGVISSHKLLAKSRCSFHKSEKAIPDNKREKREKDTKQRELRDNFNSYQLTKSC